MGPTAVEGRKCESPSHKFKGMCMNRDNCATDRLINYMNAPKTLLAFVLKKKCCRSKPFELVAPKQSYSLISKDINAFRKHLYERGLRELIVRPTSFFEGVDKNIWKDEPEELLKCL
ncbi:hypothetical protein Gotur_007535 [Gossypium turneri]